MMNLHLASRLLLHVSLSSSLSLSFSLRSPFRGCSCNSDLSSSTSCAVTCASTSDQVTSDESDLLDKQTREGETRDASSRATSSCSTVNYESFDVASQKYPCDDDEDAERGGPNSDDKAVQRGTNVSSVQSSNLTSVKCTGSGETLRDGKNHTNSSSHLAMGTIAKAIVSVSSSAVKRRRQSLQFLVSSVPSFHRSLNKRRSEFDLASALQDQQNKVSDCSVSYFSFLSNSMKIFTAKVILSSYYHNIHIQLSSRFVFSPSCFFPLPSVGRLSSSE